MTVIVDKMIFGLLIVPEVGERASDPQIFRKEEGRGAGVCVCVCLLLGVREWKFPQRRK